MPSAASRGYIIGPGYVLDISVWNNEALTKSLTVLPDGKIHYPLIGEVTAGGKTLAVLQKELKDKIKAFVHNPELSVMVNKVNSLLIYVIGKVMQSRQDGKVKNFKCLPPYIFLKIQFFFLHLSCDVFKIKIK